MVGHEPDLACWSIVIDSLGKQGHISVMLEYIKHMEMKGISMDTVLATSVAHSLYSHGYKMEALKILGEIRNRGLDINFRTATWLVELLVTEKKYDDVENLYLEIKKKGYKPNPWVCMFNFGTNHVLSFSGQLSKLLNIINYMKK